MGDLADMMTCGVLCSSCGELVGDDVGYPVQCPDCADDKEYEPHPPKPPKQPLTPCPKCGVMSGQKHRKRCNISRNG